MKSFLIVLSALSACNALEIKMHPSTSLRGDTFDTDTYGKDIIFAFWRSSEKTDRLWKTSKFDMLATEAHKIVRSKNVTIADVDCTISANHFFCKRFDAFDVTDRNYPMIGYSFHNEPFKRYDGDLSYPALSKFLFDYFERSCTLNEKYCSDEELQLLNETASMTLRDIMSARQKLLDETDVAVTAFRNWKGTLEREFLVRKKRLEDSLEINQKLDLVYGKIIGKYDIEARNNVIGILNEERLQKAQNRQRTEL